MTLTTVAQKVILTEDFTDGNFSSQPAWSGNDSDFTIFDNNGNYQLRLEANSTSSSSYLSIPSSTLYGSWEFYIRLDFPPSGSNNLAVILISDQADLTGDINGYALVAGESGSDDVFRLVRYEEGAITKTLLSGTTDLSSGGAFQVLVEHRSSGEWSLSTSPGYGSIPVQKATGFDATNLPPGYMGFLTNYTSTRTDRFYFDDITVTRSPIELASVHTISNRELEVHFTLSPNPATVSASDFSLDNGMGSPGSVTVSNNIATLTYVNPLPGGNYMLTANNIEDPSGNPIPPNATVSFSLFDPFAAGDIIINEFTYTASGGFPEYVELKNTTSKRFNLSDWEIGDANSSSTIAGGDLILGEHDYLVISSDTTTLNHVFGNQEYVLSNLPTLNNSGDTIRLYTESDEIADSLTYTPNWGGDDVALERRSGTTPGFYRENWGNAVNPKGGTPGQPNEVAQDLNPPKLTEAIILSARKIKLLFDEKITAQSASREIHFNITNSSVRSATVTAAKTVELMLGTNLQNAHSYTLSITGVEDIFGNSINETNTSLTYYSVSPAEPGAIFINEFNYDPTAGSTEYVEIYNPTSKSFDLQGWSLSDNRKVRIPITDKLSILPPNSFVVLAPDNTLRNNFPGISLITVSGFPALNNSGDQIRIRNKNGTLLDSLQYYADWGGTEIALERRTTDIASTYSENWGIAPNGIGTPGSKNGISGDDRPPVFKTAEALDASTLQLVFSEHLDPSAATDVSKYQISPAHAIRLVIVNRDTVSLFLDNPMISGRNYHITVTNIEDIFGNKLDTGRQKVEYLRIHQARRGDVIINEILFDPGEGNPGEFVELYNSSEKNFNLSGWYIGDGSSKISLDKNIQLRSHEFLIISGSTTANKLTPETVTIRNFPSLNNGSDAVYLQNESNHTIDSLHYSPNWERPAGGHSLERRDPEAASNDPANWKPNTADRGHSAGTVNTKFRKDRDSPDVIFAKALGRTMLELHFDEFIKPTKELSFLVGGQPMHIFSFEPADGNRIVLKPSVTKRTPPTHTTLTVNNLDDVKGNRNPRTEIAIAHPLEREDLVINEILYRPLSDNEDNKPDQSEYIELRNRQDYAISLEGIQLHDAPDEKGRVQTLPIESTTARWLPAGGTALVYADQQFHFKESKVATFFALGDNENSSIIRVDNTTLGLATTGDAVYLADSTGTVIDSVHYEESWQNPSLIDTRGIALERISPEAPSNDASNWSSSVHPKGGTPHAENSIYQKQAAGSEEIGISFHPNPFTPDNDGSKDFLFIHYKLDQRDYLINVHIYDRYGRHVRELADGRPAGFEGQLIWKGRKDDKSRNRIGIYIVVFEAYGSTSGADRAFKKTVVLARKLY